jgi:hypothetical protein
MLGIMGDVAISTSATLTSTGIIAKTLANTPMYQLDH